MILRSLTRYRDAGLLILRLGIGVAFLAHGWPKISGGPEFWAKLGHNAGFSFLPAFWGFMAAFAEFGGAILLILGFLFRPACLLMLINMLVAVSFHMRLPPGAPMSGFGGWSHAAELAVVFLSLLLIGPGRYSIDRE